MFQKLMNFIICYLCFMGLSSLGIFHSDGLYYKSYGHVNDISNTDHIRYGEC